MKSIRICARFCLFCTLFVLPMLLVSCSSQENGKKAFTKTLFSDYIADAEFLFECDGASVAGTARITRDDNIRIDITAPDPYAGISVETDASEQSSIISISYSGIKADISKIMLDKINLALTLFSDTAAAAAEKTPASDFVRCEEVYTVEGLGETDAYRVEFTLGDTQYIYVYDSITGTPLDLCAKNSGSVVEVKMKKFKAAEQA